MRYPLSFVLLPALALAVACEYKPPQPQGSAYDAARFSSIQNFAVYGDSQTSHVMHRAVVSAMVETDPEAVFHTGDLVADGTVGSKWDTFDLIIAPILALCPFYPALGNHEKNSRLYFDNFVLPGNERWYSVDWNEQVHIVVLDFSASCIAGSEQYEWLAADLAAAGSMPFRIVAFHYPLYTVGRHPADEKGLRATLEPLFLAQKVSVVFAGHNHCYERIVKDSITYITTGGGGAPLYGSMTADRHLMYFASAYHFCNLHVNALGNLVIDAVTEDMQLIDQAVIPAP
jgi:3',5'-cyclic AMP phosphodiesterase CpdA